MRFFSVRAPASYGSYTPVYKEVKIKAFFNLSAPTKPASNFFPLLIQDVHRSIFDLSPYEEFVP